MYDRQSHAKILSIFFFFFLLFSHHSQQLLPAFSSDDELWLSILQTIGAVWSGFVVFASLTKTTVKLWSLELARFEHQGSLELVRRSQHFPIHLMLKHTPGSNSDGSNSWTQSMVHRAIFSSKNAMMARTKYFFTWISHKLDLSSLLFP